MKNKQDILKLHPMIGRLTPMQWDEIHKAMDAYLNEYKAEQLAICGVVKPLNFNINKDLKIKSLGDLKRAYPDNQSHRVSSFGGCIN